MNFNIYLSCALSLLCTIATAQEIAIDDHKEELRNSMLGYIETLNSRLSSELDSIREHGDADLENNPEDLIIFKRLKSINQTIPLEYNSQIRAYIDRYTSQNYRPYMNKLKGLSQYYFPIYEQVFGEQGIPEEVKYLSLVESSLDPHLVSRSGAVGPWQFMYATAKIYNLDMDSYLDERKDAYASSYAVTQYLSEAYNQFGDWLLALASYNCGRGCVQRAIARSGLQQPSFWELAPYLPQETRNYIPKYVAMTYVMEMADFYDIQPSGTELEMESKVLMVDKTVDMKHIANAVQISVEQLKLYNPAYKRTVVNGTAERPKRLVLPITEGLNDSLLYIALHTNTSPRAEPSQLATTYQVKQGETIHDVSKRFDVSVQNLRAWNGLNSNSDVVGKTLVLTQNVSPTLASNVNKAASQKKGPKTVYYTVKKGDSLDRIARNYKGVTASKLKADNNLKSNLICPGMKLKVVTM